MSTMYSGSVAISCECVHNGFSIFYQTICSIHFVIIRKFRGRGAPYQNTYKLLKINGFEASAPCKGRTSRIGATPPRHKRADCRKMACIGGTMSTWELCTHVMRLIYARFVEGRCPYFDILPLQGAILLNPNHGGKPRVSQPFGLLYPGLRYPCPYRAPRSQNH